MTRVNFEARVKIVTRVNLVTCINHVSVNYSTCKWTFYSPLDVTKSSKNEINNPGIECVGIKS